MRIAKFAKTFRYFLWLKTLLVMPSNPQLVPCYNRGCGQKFDPENNTDQEACRHHPGAPFFHDAYKGWSCCNKKCTDFTEFLNIKGCTTSVHSNVKPPEPIKQDIDKDLEKEAERPTIRAPIVASTLVRPPFDSPLTTLKPTIAESLKQITTSNASDSVEDSAEIAVGTSCKNGGCSASYQGPSSNEEDCIYHPGCPIFHEGLKFWSCCQKKTTDFNTFLSQPGCTTGAHKWKKEAQAAGTVKCRWDWHQTPDYITVSIYAKNYHPTESFVKINPVRLKAKLVFPKESNSSFEIDLELRGMINVGDSSASMLGTKLEIKLKKLEPGSWSKLDFPRVENKPIEKEDPKPQAVEDDMEDLSGVEAVHSIGKVSISEVNE